MTPEQSLQAAFYAAGEFTPSQPQRKSQFQRILEAFRGLPRHRAERQRTITKATVAYTPTPSEAERHASLRERFENECIRWLVGYTQTSGSELIEEAKMVLAKRLANGEKLPPIERPVPCDVIQPGETEHQNKFC
jgi:hypothetical protein